MTSFMNLLMYCHTLTLGVNELYFYSTKFKSLKKYENEAIKP